MSVFSNPIVADAVGRLLTAVAQYAPTPKQRDAFAISPVRTEAVHVATRNGAVPCRVYRPAVDASLRPAGDGALPIYVNLHGGGFVIGYPEQDDPWCRFVAAGAGAVVLNVDYATAPGHRFPVALEQAYDVVTWAAAPAREWDGSRLCVGGQSSGGNLATGVARLALERGGPRIALQVLNYPVLDLVTDPSSKPRLGGRVPPPWLGLVFNQCYVPDPAQRRDRLVSPAWGGNAQDLEGIAPAVVITCERDSLRAEAERYADRLRSAGALIEYRELAGVDHGYDIRRESPELVRDTYTFIADTITRMTRSE